VRPTVSSARGRRVVVVAKQLEVSEQTLQRWRAQYGGRKADDAKG
jgi:transposase-like protein